MRYIQLAIGELFGMSCSIFRTVSYRKETPESLARQLRRDERIIAEYRIMYSDER